MRYGYFDTDKDEYVIERPDTPASFTNYLGTRDYCVVLSHSGGGYSYYKSAQTGRVTRFRANGVPLDRPGRYLYVRDDADGDYWSVSWQPVGASMVGEGAGRWTCAHGMGYTRFESAHKGIEATQTVFVPLDDPLEIWDVRLANSSSKPRTITLVSYVEFSFHTITIDNENLQMSLYASGSSYDDGIIEYDFHYEPWTAHFMTCSAQPDSYDTMRDAFIGPYRSETNPIAVERGVGSNSAATTGNHCGAMLHRITLAPGQTARLVYLLGHGYRDTGAAMRRKYASPDAVDAELRRLRRHWRAKQDRLRIDTPHQGMNTMINTWTLLQAETCVQWSRFASFVEVGGRTGLGYRDTAQDVMSVIHSNPAKTRSRILELLRAQTRAGYGLHLFDPKAFDPDAEPLPDIPSPTVVPTPSGASLIHGLADTSSDSHLWLVPSVVEYVRETGDLAFLDLEVPFAEGDAAPVYDHLRAALDFTADQIGPNGVALGLRADWNDCLNLGGGESALVTFLHAWAMRSFLEVAERLGRSEDVARYRAEIDRIAQVADEHLWDGQWWLRGFTREGAKIGSHEDEEGKIFLEHQAWPVIAGITSSQRGTVTMDSVRSLLGSRFGCHLNWPAFTKVNDSVGFVTRVYPGVKENASIFSHPNAWPIIAEAILGRGDEAVALYDSILPYHQNDIIETRAAEPYAYAQFVYGRDHEFFGRAQNPWLTGTAGWMYTAATKWILGVRPTLAGLVVDPCIPRVWDTFSVRRQWRGAVYRITVRNPRHVSKGVVAVTVDGVEQDPATPIAPRPAGSTLDVVVTMG